MTVHLVGCVRCGAALDVEGERTEYVCPACDTVAQCCACPHCARARCLPAMTLDKDTRCPGCGSTFATRSWIDRPAPLAQVSPEVVTADHYRRVVTGSVVDAIGIPWAAANTPCTVSFGVDQLDITAPGVGGYRNVEAIPLSQVDDVSISAAGHPTVTTFVDIAIVAGPRRLVLRSSTFGAAALDALLAPVRIRIDTARRAHFPVVLPPPPPIPPGPAMPPSPGIPAPTPTSSSTKWVFVGVAAALAVAVIVLGGILIGSRSSSDRPNSAQSVPAQVGESPTDDPASSGSTRQPASGRPLATPALIPGPDGSAQKESCPSGVPIMGSTGWPARAGRGTTMTSCQFARNVGEAYWRSGAPSDAPRRVVAAGAVPCALGGSLCEDGLFVMNCRVVAGQDWITCEGGRNAVVYLHGR